MNLEKIKNYNQKILAIFGTILIVFAVIGLISFVIIIINEFDWNDQGELETGILSDEKIVELQRENKRKQIISFDNAQLVDTLNLIYCIPVSHKTLNKPEEIDEDLLGLLNADIDKSSYDKRYSRQFYGSFNNLLIYDYKSKDIKKLFDKRINFKIIETEYFEDDILIVFNAADQDTFKDGVINSKDYSALYIYSINGKKLKKIQKTEMTISNFKFVENSKNLIISFGVDHDKNGSFDDYKEPRVLEIYDYDSEELKMIVDKNTILELQNTLEGSAN